MYVRNPKKNANGGFRARASFPITPQMIIRINEVCEQQGFTFAKACQEAMELYASSFEAGELYNDPPDGELEQAA